MRIFFLIAGFVANPASSWSVRAAELPGDAPLTRKLTGFASGARVRPFSRRMRLPGQLVALPVPSAWSVVRVPMLTYDEFSADVYLKMSV